VGGSDVESEGDLVAICALVILVAGGGYAIRNYLGRCPTPEELERRRRMAIHRLGKMADAEIIDVEPVSVSIVYSYMVAGVVYTASQDVATLQSLLPRDMMTMVGPVSFKFDPRNPANSIVVCEEWSGLRQAARMEGETTPGP
jgi:hypothetical protein